MKSMVTRKESDEQLCHRLATLIPSGAAYTAEDIRNANSWQLDAIALSLGTQRSETRKPTTLSNGHAGPNVSKERSMAEVSDDEKAAFVLQVQLWDAINRYVETCGGDPSKLAENAGPRMDAVVEVEKVFRAALATAPGGGP